MSDLAAVAVVARRDHRLWIELERRRSSAPGVTATSITFGTHQPLTGPAAPGYSEIAPASQAYFNYVNAHGGVFGRKIHLIIKDDAYNPTNTVTVVHQLVLQNNVFGIFEGLGTPTHTKVVGYPELDQDPGHVRRLRLPVLGQRGQPALDVRLAAQLHDRGQDPRPVHQAALRGQEGRRALPGRRLRPGWPGRHPGRGARLADRRQGALPVGHDLARAPGHGPEVLRRQGAGRLHRPDLHRDRAADVVHARLLAAARRLQRRDRPDHVGRSAEDRLQGQGLGQRADRRRDHRRLPAVVQRHVATRGSSCS